MSNASIQQHFTLVPHDRGNPVHDAMAEDIALSELVADGDAPELHWLYENGEPRPIYTYRTERGTWFVHDVLNLTEIPHEAETKDLAMAGLIAYLQDPTPVLSLEDIVSAGLIARSNPRRVSKMRATIAALRPDTLVKDGDDGKPITMADLAKMHQVSAYPDESPMSDRTAWGWAVSDLVFGGWRIAETSKE